jgi:hypothetical protein
LEIQRRLCPQVRGILESDDGGEEETMRIRLRIANSRIERDLNSARLTDLYRNELMPLILGTTAEAGLAGMAAYRCFIGAARVCFSARARNENVQRHEER